MNIKHITDRLAGKHLSSCAGQPCDCGAAPPCTCPSGDGSLRHPCPQHPAASAAMGAGSVSDVSAQLNGFDIAKLPPILISCVAKLWPGSQGMFWEAALEKMPERIEQLMARPNASRGYVQCVNKVPCQVQQVVRSTASAADDLYAALRSMHWSDGKLAVIEAKDLKLGVQTYSGEMLDEAILRHAAKGAGDL